MNGHEQSRLRPRHPAAGQGGFVLMAVTVMVFVLIIAGLAVFSTASYETRSSMRDQASAQAFYLADAAIERARARLLEDRTWRDGWSAVPLAGGTYDLSIADTTVNGSSDPHVRLTGTGTFADSRRRITVVGLLPPAALEIGLLATGTVTANAAMCIDGRVHVNGDADFGYHDQHLQCGTLTEGFAIRPPQIYTDPDHLTGSTYYDVRGARIGGVHQARIFDRDGTDITTSLGDSLLTITSYNAGTGRYQFDFGDAATLDHYFDQATGVFSRTAGDASVIVDFGGSPLSDPPGTSGVANVIVRGNGSVDLGSTIINTRFTGATDEQRIDPAFWSGGTTTVERLTVEPRNGIALICDELVCDNAVNMGTAGYPGLLYITGGNSVINSSFDLYGSLICMGSLTTNARADIVYDSSFLQLLPDYVESEWLAMVSGTLRTVHWSDATLPPL